MNQLLIRKLRHTKNKILNKYSHVKNALNNLRSINNSKLSYSQCGEDLIIEFIFNSLNIKNPFYLDIGANHPTYLSNTYFFYKNGCNGICIEPDPILFDYFKKKRSRDICINCGVGTGKERLENFYIMTTKTLNTFSNETAESYQNYGSNKIEKIIPIKLLPIENILDKYTNRPINFVSLDTEGHDLEILKNFCFSKYKPEVFCIETLTYTEDKTEKKIPAIINLMENNGYFVYADTYINTIFVNNNSWVNR